jgi:hypothetical protein
MRLRVRAIFYSRHLSRRFFTDGLLQRYTDAIVIQFLKQRSALISRIVEYATIVIL